MIKNKPLIIIVFSGRGWILNRMADAIKEVLKDKYDILTSYSGAFQPQYGGNPDFFKNIPIDGYCNLTTMDKDLEPILHGNEVIVSTIHHWVDDSFYNDFIENSKYSNVIINVSNEWKQKLEQNGIKKRIEVIHPFVDKIFFHKFKKEKSKKIRLGIFSRIHDNDEDDRKGVRHLLSLVKYIKEQNLQNKFKLVISGGGWDNIIKNIVENYKIEVEYQPSLFNEEMPKLYNKLDFYLMLSDVEGGPFSVMEAMAQKVMVISNNVGVVKDIGIDKENIAIIDNSNSKQILDTILYYYNNKQEYQKIINNAYKIALEHTPEKVYSKYIEIFDSLIDTSKIQYNNDIDLEEVQKYLNNFGHFCFEPRKIASKKKIILIKILKPFLILLKTITPVKSWRKKIKKIYKNKY